MAAECSWDSSLLSIVLALVLKTHGASSSSDDWAVLAAIKTVLGTSSEVLEYYSSIPSILLYSWRLDYSTPLLEYYLSTLATPRLRPKAVKWPHSYPSSSIDRPAMSSLDFESATFDRLWRVRLSGSQ